MPRAQNNSNTKSDAKVTRKKNEIPQGVGPTIPDTSSAQMHPTNSDDKSLGRLHVVIRLWRALYATWKWLPLFYVAWLALTWSLAYGIATGLAPLCSVPFFGPQMPLCTLTSESTDQSADIRHVIASQEAFILAINDVGRKFDPSKNMHNNEYALRDLRTSVKASNLPYKEEVASQLETLINDTRLTVR
jgi:hypothetical protein